MQAAEIQSSDYETTPFTFEKFPRLRKLRHELLTAPLSICIERAKLVTEFFQHEGFDESHPVRQQAEALRYVLERLTPTLFEDELIAGSTTRLRLGSPVYPEFLSIAVWPDLPTIAKRAVDPIAISDDDADYLSNVVFPFWKDRTIIEQVRKEGDNPLFLRLMERIVFFMLPKANGISHLIPDYETVVQKGLLAIRAEAALREKSAPDQESAELYQAIGISIDGVLSLARRYAEACEKEAERSSAARAAELRSMAGALRNVPAKPASTLQEALQSIWITQVALHQENSNMALSFGRIDQILNPYYEADLAAGRIDERRAAELIGCFYIKMGDHMPTAPSAAKEIIGGASTDQAVTVGGLKPDGTDGVNEVTYVMLNLSALLALREPNMCARLHPGSSARYRRAVVEAIYRNGAAPALYNDTAVVEALTAHGVKLEDARDYGLVGCVEPMSCYRTMGATGSIVLNLAAVLELTLNHGVHPQSGLQIGPAAEPAKLWENFDSFLDAFKAQLQYLVDLSVLGNNRFAEVHAKLHPTPLLSGVMRGAMESGRDVTRGGALYNSSGVAVVGFADVADSFTALKEWVFDKKAVAPADLMRAIEADFEGYEKIYALLAHKAPKYGTDDERADSMAARLVETVAAAFENHPNPRGGRYHIGFWTVTLHTALGGLTGALPNGKRKGAPLASGATPVSGVARKGPTASYSSTRKLPAAKLANGIANNHKFSRALLGKPGNLDVFEKLIAGYFKGGGMQAQFIIQDRQTLIDAQKNPEMYRDLLVRVSGYTAYFGDLTHAMQNEIISRTEDAV